MFSIGDCLRLCKLGFEAGEPLKLPNDWLDYKSLHPRAITSQPTKDLTNTNQNQIRDASSQIIKNQRLSTHEEQISTFRSNFENDMSVNIQLEHENKILQDRCNSLEENIRTHRSSYENALSVNAQLQYENNELQSKLNAFYVTGSQSMAKSGTSENTNDKYSNTRLADRFEGNVKNVWLDLCDRLHDTFPELDRLKALSNIIKTVSTKCMEKADADIQIITSSYTVDKKEMNNFLDLRRRCGQTESKIKDVVEEIADLVWKYENVETIVKTNSANQTIVLVRRFIKDMIEVCWLMSISQPPLVLNFDVEGIVYTPDVKQKFTEYSTEDVIDSDCEPGTIILVVWPSVEHRDKSGFLKKGEVIVVPRCDVDVTN
ncbi:uncharacterized protein LOC127860423 isoform X2 [Dreissena polymorpha]|uniref:uncharacterized protein LOC127860423 isoform X2 n=1 Tax=Dreissena polymorpha TaxID=45954 RepID=UPI00226487FC|nr:uncharacterized protein LOC127860423 isoform X2 [Dreissena polymorpha]